MNILLDTHVALWAITDHPRLGLMARELIASPKARVHVSVASLWEIAIKHALRRGDMPISSEQALDYFGQSGFHILPIEAEHALAVADLPPHHQDPFDRMLVAQSMVEPMRLITADALVALYGGTVIKI